MKEKDVVIIGGGPAGRLVVHALHSAEKQFSITMIKDEEVNVNRCAVPYGISNNTPIKKFQIPNTLVTDFGADLVIDRVKKIDPQKNEVETATGARYIYRYLVLATGSRPIIPKLPGIKSDRIIPVRSLDDLQGLRSFVESGARKAVIVGGGYIGLEVAAELYELGVEVTIVEMMPRILAATTEPEFISVMEKTLTDKGIHLYTGTRVTEFIAVSDHAVGVKIDTGDIMESDFVVMAAGVVPNTELAAEAGIETSRFGIVTDEHMQTSVKNIYAAGDCAAKTSFVNKQPTRGEFGTNAVFMAKIVAQNILGSPQTFPGVINANSSVLFEWSIGSAGMTEKMAQDAQLDVVTGFSDVLDQYPMMADTSPIHMKLVFNRVNGKLIGGSVLRKGRCTAQNVDFISFAIQMGATLDDLLTYQYATHPKLAAKPSDNTYVFAVQDAMKKM